ncbi:HsdR family type I site-specific deoxyribonuclease [Thermaerobacter sp. PB12/4term]|nr:HsdR family type I site-specific deoxyribonuclease [Thermaerobacter sp. PB12/4term]
MPLGNERAAVQNPLIRYAEEVGWRYLPPDEALRLRRGETGIVLHEVLVRQLQRLNPGVIDDVVKAEEVVGRLTRVMPSIEGNLQAWEWLKGLKTVFVEAERRERNVRLLDPDKLEANTFHVTDELRFISGTKSIRPDAVFFVNGIPVIVVETKAAHRVEGIAEAFDQIRRYHREGPELLAVLQVHALTHLVRFYYGATWSLSRKDLYNWRDEQAGDFETLVKHFFAPRRVLRMLTDYILFARKDGELSKVVLRPHQMRAVERVLQRCRDPEKRRGLIWHTQGSGKTYTMITVAKRLLENPAFGNPTVLMLVDRNELEQQLFTNLEAVGFGHVTVAQSKRHLYELLRSDQRGLIVSMIHKFDDMPPNVNTRRNIFVLVDEAHRSTGGDLGNYLMGALPNATYLGFTGTPIDKTAHGKGTFKVFGVDDQPKGYLDKYSIRESIEDGTTVPLHYALAPNDLRVDREILEREFLDLAELEGVSDVEELNRVLERAVTLKNMLKNPDRVDRVAAFVAKHFRETVEPMGYKAFLVAVDREACALYKEALDRYLPPDYSAVVISRGHNDPPELARWHLTTEKEQEIRKAFRRPDALPKVLIVTEKLLTGYDAPILYCMYLDKPMRDHVLLQAIARVNRPYEDEEGRKKPAGFVLDFVGIFDNLEKALAFDSEDVQSVVQGIDILKERFATMMAEARRDLLSLVSGKPHDRAAEAVLEHFRDSEERHRFFEFFRELQELYEILSPDPFLRPYMADYEELARMYRLLRSAYEQGILIDRGFLRKTEQLVREHTETYFVGPPKGMAELTVEALERLAASDQPDTVKVFNLLKAIRDLVEEEGGRSPFLISIGDRAEAIAQAYQDRQATTQETLRELQMLVQEYRKARDAQSQIKLSPEAFAVYWFLRKEGVAEAEEVARRVGEALERYPHWCLSEEQGRELRIALYKVLIEAGIETVIEVAERLLKLLWRKDG